MPIIVPLSVVFVCALGVRVGCVWKDDDIDGRYGYGGHGMGG